MQNQISYNITKESLDVRKFVLKLLRKWYWFALSIVLCYLIAYFVNSYSTPLYKISASLLINDDKKSIAEIIYNSLNRNSGRKNIDNEISVLKSYNMTIKALEQLKDFRISFYLVGKLRNTKLYKNVPFTVILDSTSSNLEGCPVNVTLLSTKKCKIEIDSKERLSKIIHYGETYMDNNFKFKIFLKNPGKLPSSVFHKYSFTINNMIELVKLYRDKLTISTNEKKETVLKLTVIGAVPQMEADYLNKIMKVFIESGANEKKQTTVNTINFIDEQLSSVLDSIHRAEDKLQKSGQTNQIVDSTTEGSVIFSHLQKLKDEAISIEIELRYFKYVQGYIEKKSNFSEMVAPTVLGINNEILNSKLEDLANMFEERAILTLTAQIDNPSLLRINVQIQSALDILQETISEIIYVKNIKLNKIEKQIASIEDEVQWMPVAKRRLMNIQHVIKLNDDIYTYLLKKRFDAVTIINSNLVFNKVLNEATGEHPLLISPRRSKNIKIALALGFLIPFSFIVIIEYFKVKILDINDIERSTKVPIVGFVGHHENMLDLPVVENPKSVIAESFRAIRTNLQFVMHDKAHKVISITSTMSGEGKTFCAINLAAIIAQGNKKTLLLSFDLRKPKIHHIFNLRNIIGISTYLIGKSTYEEIICRTNIENLYITTAGPVPPNPAELIGTDKMEEFFSRVRQSFDLILIDTPPIAIVTDAELLTRYSDYNIFVVRYNYSDKEVLHIVDDLYFNHGIKFGILVNDVKINSYYGYGLKYSSYGYGNAKSDYYGNNSPLTLKDKLKAYFG